MKKILILTYYFKPCNYVAANRPNSYAALFREKGWEVTVVTRSWNGQEKVWSDYLSSGGEFPEVVQTAEGINVHYLPYKAFSYPSNKLLSTIKLSWYNLQGNFNVDLNYSQFKPYVLDLAKANNYDFMLVSTPPLEVLKVGAEVSKAAKIKLLIDVRDFENDIVLFKKPQISFLRMLQHKLLMKYLKNWISEAHSVFTASPPLTEYITNATGHKAFTLNNGFDDFIKSSNNQEKNEYFNISVIGTLYKEANLKVLFDGIKLLFERNKRLKIKFNLIGVKAVADIAREFELIIPAPNLNLTHRMNRLEALEIAADSHVLFLAGFDNLKGAYTTKVFEYLGLRKNIIQVPGDRDVVEELINYTQSGKAPHTAEEFYKDIMDWYIEWEESGTLVYGGINSKILEYSRRSQFEKLFTRLQD